MCQMCDEYKAELRRMGIAMDEKVTVELDDEVTTADESPTRAREIRAMTPPGVIRSDSTLPIREDRDRRSSIG